MSTPFQKMYETSLAFTDLALRLNQVTNGTAIDLQHLNSLHPFVDNALDEIDAAMFSGDTFYEGANRQRLEHFMGRWARKLLEISKEADVSNLEINVKPSPPKIQTLDEIEAEDPTAFMNKGWEDHQYPLASAQSKKADEG